MSKSTETYLELRNKQCENVNDPNMSVADFEREQEELAQQLQSELERCYGTFTISNEKILELLFVLVNNLYIAEVEDDLIDLVLLVIQKFATLHDLKFDVATMEWPR